MNQRTLETLLSSSHLAVAKEDAAYVAPDDSLLTLYMSVRGSEVIRLAKIEQLILDPSLTEVGLIVLKREGATTLVELEAIVGVEQDLSAVQKEKRRTGFM